MKKVIICICYVIACCLLPNTALAERLPDTDSSLKTIKEDDIAFNKIWKEQASYNLDSMVNSILLNNKNIMEGKLLPKTMNIATFAIIMQGDSNQSDAHGIVMAKAEILGRPIMMFAADLGVYYKMLEKQFAINDFADVLNEVFKDKGYNSKILWKSADKTSQYVALSVHKKDDMLFFVGENKVDELAAKREVYFRGFQNKEDMNKYLALLKKDKGGL